MASNYLFLAEPADSLKCMICLEVASDPKQHVDCGKLFCSECLEKNGKKPCPNCRAEDPQFFKDKKSLREIRGLHVKCYNAERGCDWKGTVEVLSTHVTKCGSVLVTCPNRCKVEGESLQLMRKYLDDHLKTHCPNRAHQCEHCGEKGTFASITEEHDSVCTKKVVFCPNSKCSSIMQRGLIKTHVGIVCNYTVVACKYARIGCSVKEMRIDIKQHEVDTRSHFPVALDRIMDLVNTITVQDVTISSLQDTMSSLKVTTCSLEDTTSSQTSAISSLNTSATSLADTTSMMRKNLYTLSREKPIIFNLPEYRNKKGDDIIFYSEPFFTSCHGYRMCIIIYPNGGGDGVGTHVSVMSQLLEGPYDDSLSWPFLGTITVSLLNQLADDNHHNRMIRFYTTHDARAGCLRGYHKFLPQTKLSLDFASNTQYLMEDTLYFRVAVEEDHHKPWLDCTYHTK